MHRPENVRIIRRDGTVIPCELGYVGVDNNGMDVWSIATVALPGDLLQVDDMPDEARLVGACADGAIPFSIQGCNQPQLQVTTDLPQVAPSNRSLIRDTFTLIAGTSILILFRAIRCVLERM